MDILGVTESIGVTVGRASDTITSVSTTTIATTLNLLPLEMFFIASLFIFFGNEIWRKWRIKNGKLKI